MSESTVVLSKLIADHREPLLNAWLDQQRGANRDSSVDQAELREYAARFLDSLCLAAPTGQLEDITTPSWADARLVLEEVSRAGLCGARRPRKPQPLSSR
jgi:hypothetical protein